VHFQQAGESSVVLVSDKKVFRIAWRPAFISQQYLERIQKLEEQGLFKLALRYLGLAQSDRELLEEIRKDFPDDFVRPKEISRNMTAGTPIRYDEANPKHLKYLQLMRPHGAADPELYPAPRSKPGGRSQ
jgi:hypothetical protein